MKKILLLSLLCVFLNSQIVFANSSNVKIKAYDFVNAVIKGDIEAVKNYIELGANINKPFMGSTPLVYAIDKHQDEMLNFLLEKGANPNAENGTPPLYYAVVEKNKYAVAKLLKSGASIDKTYMSVSAFDLAKTYKKNDILDIFYEYKADSNKFNPDIYKIASVKQETIKEKTSLKEEKLVNHQIEQKEKLSANIVYTLDKKDTDLIQIPKTKPVSTKAYNQKLSKDYIEYQKQKKQLTDDQYQLFLILDKILRANKLQYQNWRIGIDIATDDMNAYASTANLIIVNSSLYDSLFDNPDALAFIVAHELSHLILGHLQIHYENTANIKKLELQVKNALIESDRQNYLSDINNAYGNYGSAIANSVSSLAYSLAVAAMESEINRVYAQERQMELEADSEALILMTRAGYNPHKSKDALQLLSELPNIYTNRSTHPDSYTRNNNVSEGIFLNDNNELKNQGKREILNSKVSPLKKSTDKKTIILSKGNNYPKYKYIPETKEDKLIKKAYSYYLEDDYVLSKDLFEKAYMLNCTGYIAPLYLSYMSEYEFKKNQTKKSLKYAKRWAKKAYNNNSESKYTQKQLNDVKDIIIALKAEKKRKKQEKKLEKKNNKK